MTASFFRDQETALPPEAARGHFVANNGAIYVEPALFHGRRSRGANAATQQMEGSTLPLLPTRHSCGANWPRHAKES